MLKGIEILSKFDTVLRDETVCSEDDKYFIHNWEYDFAKALLHNFGDKTACKIANLILCVTNFADD